MRVLLIAPLDPDRPDLGRLMWLMGGENTFTKSLLETPPPGVEYVHIEEAVKTGEVKYRPAHFVWLWLQRFRILPLGPRVIDIQVTGKFDLIHSHVYPVRVDKPVPVLVSDSSANWLTLRYYFGWPEWRIKLAYGIAQYLFRKFDVTESDNCRNLVVWSRFARKIHGGGKVIHPGIADPGRKKVKHKDINIVFVGTWFVRKGGKLVVQAWRKLKCKTHNVQLVVVGEVAKEVDLTGVEHYRWLPREKIMAIYARGDIFVNVPLAMEGFGVAVVEAMAWGMPVVMSKIGALPEIAVGKVVEPNNLKQLEAALEELIVNKKERLRLGRLARTKYLSDFTVGTMGKLLRAAYDKCAAGKK